MFKWWFWKRWARKVVIEDCGTCALCRERLYPGDFVGITTEGKPVHAGFHFSMTEKDAFCETAAIGNGIWGKDGFARTCESAIEESLRTNEAVLR